MPIENPQNTKDTKREFLKASIAAALAGALNFSSAAVQQVSAETVPIWQSPIEQTVIPNTPISPLDSDFKAKLTHASEEHPVTIQLLGTTITVQGTEDFLNQIILKYPEIKKVFEGPKTELITESGKISVYGFDEVGARGTHTANGEVFDSVNNKTVAAPFLTSKTSETRPMYPYGTILKLTRTTKNGQEFVVYPKETDIGNFGDTGKYNREVMFDCSRATINALGVKATPSTQLEVKIERILPKPQNLTKESMLATALKFLGETPRKY